MSEVATAAPSEVGVDARGVERFVDALDADPSIEPHGLIVQRHGRRCVEAAWAPHDTRRPRLCYSLSKTFTGTALGLLLGDGLLTLDDLATQHLPEETAGAGERARRMRVRHLASMASGHDRELVAEAAAKDPDDPVRGFFSIEPEHEPGTHFMYNQPPVLALATMLQRLAGTTLTEVLRPRVLEPLGIERFAWQQHQPGVDLGYSGVHTSLDAIARLGQLHLDDGVWGGRRLLPEGWVAQASAVQTPNPERVEPDWRQGYGFQLWRNQHGYRGDGAFGQYMVVLPEEDAVVAFYSNILDMQAVMDLLWEHLRPALRDGAGSPEADASLAARLDGLALPTPGARRGGSAPDVPALGFRPVERPVPSHRSVTSAEVVDGDLVLHEADGSLRLPITETWAVVDPGLGTSAARLPDGRLVVDVCFLSTPHRLVVELDPSAGTFVARWPLPPLFGAGTSRQLARMAQPLA